MTDDLDHTAAAVDAMLDRAGLVVAPADLGLLHSLYAAASAGVAAMYALPDARDEVPATGFSAVPSPHVWWR